MGYRWNRFILKESNFMVIRGEPKELSKYYKCSSPISDNLQSKGFVPKYMDMKYLYFEMTPKLKDYIGGEK